MDAIVFDFDGLLVDTESAVFAIWQGQGASDHFYQRMELT